MTRYRYEIMIEGTQRRSKDDSISRGIRRRLRLLGVSLRRSRIRVGCYTSSSRSCRTRTLLRRDKERYVRGLAEDVECHLNANDFRPAYRALKKRTMQVKGLESVSWNNR